MTSWAIALGLALVAAADSAPAAETAADAVTLRDGSVVLGQVVEPSPRGTLTLYVRRAWAEARVPALARRWADAERPEARRAIRLRRDRLARWKAERQADPGRNDPIGDWIDAELDRLDGRGADGAGPESSTLMVVKIGRGEIKGIVRRPKSSARLLRLGWLSGFRDVETMSRDDLKSALEGRGFAPGGDAPVAIDRLLPIVAEPEPLWLARRAATEVTHDAGLQFIRQGPLFLPEPAPGQPVDVAGAAAALGGVARMLGGDQPATIDEQLRPVAARGRVGAVVTEQRIAPDLGTVEVTMTLWVRHGERWAVFGSQAARARTADAKGDEAAAIGDDPQVQAVFQFLSTIGFDADPGVKQATLNVGAATRRALGSARAAFHESLAALALPLDRRGAAKGGDRRESSQTH